jgi:hypothetical protein
MLTGFQAEGATPTLEALHEFTTSTLLPTLLPLIAPALTKALDGDSKQAEMFKRRFANVCHLLSSPTTPTTTHAIFYIALVCRAYEILDSPADPNSPSKRALRMRAVSDFYYSHAAVLHHQLSSAAAPQTFPSLISQGYESATPLGPGLTHLVVKGQSANICGPIKVNVLKIDTSLRRLHCVDARPQSIAEHIGSQSCDAAISGGFFLYSEAPIEHPSKQTDPVGLLVSNSMVVNPPSLGRAAIVESENDGVAIKRVGLVDWTVTIGDSAAAGVKLTVSADNHVTAYNRAHSQVAPRPKSSSGFSVSIVNSHLVNFAEAGESALDIPLAGIVLVVDEWSGAGDLGRVRELLDTACCSWACPQNQPNFVNAMAGGPMLVENGVVNIDKEREDFTKTAPPVTFSQDETFDQNLLPRMGVGISEDGRWVYCAAVDGRDLDTPGMTLKLLATFLRDLGCKTALNFDGGSSKRMILGGSVQDNSTTEVTVKKDTLKGEEQIQLDKEQVRVLRTAIMMELKDGSGGGADKVIGDD